MTKKELTYEEWKLLAIQEGIDAVERGEVFDFEEVKSEWKK